MAIPLELLSLGGSAVLSGIMTIWGMKVKAQQQQQDALIQSSTTAAKIKASAREFKGTKSFQFTRRFIALSAVLSILVLPKVVSMIGPFFGVDVPITYGWTHVESGFWFWSDDITKLTWETATGIVITPLDTHVVSSIIGMYFGSSMVKNV